MTIIVLLALLNRARGTIGCGAPLTSHTKNAMMKTIPMMRGAILCGLPHSYCVSLDSPIVYEWGL